jgi:hypothetical protein
MFDQENFKTVKSAHCCSLRLNSARIKMVLLTLLTVARDYYSDAL